MSTITSPSNSRIKQVRALQRRKEREAGGLFLVEGIHHVGEAVAAGAAIEYLCYAPDLLASPFARDLVEQQSARGVPCYATTPAVFASLAEKENPQGLLAVVRQRTWVLESLSPESFPWGVALLSPQDPGNVGTVLRTIDAVGASGLLLLDGGADAHHPSAVRASMGALFWHPVVAAAFADFTAWAGRHGYHVYGTSARGMTDYGVVTSYTRPMILLMGSEQKGLSSEQMAMCERVIRLPMRGRVSSLNLAIAAGVMLYQMLAATG
jgi:TrmH family RNA methyltransferase